MITNSNRKSEAGITLVAMAVTIVVLMMIAIPCIVNIKTVSETDKFTKLKNDITVLKESISQVYNSDDTSNIGPKYTGDKSFLNIYQGEKNVTKTSKDIVKNPNDNDNYYVINVSKLKRKLGSAEYGIGLVDLNYGDNNYGIDTTLKELNTTDVYIINEKSRTIYYTAGVNYTSSASKKQYVYYRLPEDFTKISQKNINKEDSDDDGATDIGDKTPESTTYKKVGDVFMQTPDLSNMEPTSTYYVTYDENGNQSIAGRIDRVDTPANWYDYSSSQKKYANIVTVTGNQVAYWVWIPRYSYITKSDQTVDARFISTTNEYKKEDGTTESLASNYQVPEAFKFANQELAGYWMSKYEVSENSSPQIVINASVNIITISCDKIESGDYQVYIDGILKYTGSLPTQLTDLKENKRYDVCIVKDGKILARTDVSTKSVVVDTSNLDPESTYYVTFDDNGENMQIGNRIDKGPAPDGWYDYSKKKYANIVTINNNEASYWVWIPRYKYKVEPDTKELSVQLITTSEKNHEGSLYEVPEAFTFNGQELPGYWISKYEISESSDDQEQVVINTDVQKITVSTNNVTANQNYKVLVDGELKYTGTLPHDVEGVNPGQEYDICVIKDNIPIGRKKVSTKSIKIDLSNLDPANTYYVYWDDDGTEHNDTPISKPAPANWYDYSKKKWANIVTKANGKIAYWVWVPRYEYKINQSTKSIEINFISTDKVNNENSVYKVPEAFTFAGVELPGYWMSKYEISEPG